MIEKVKAFLSYSHKDKELKDLFVSHLFSLVRTENITFWTDDKIEGGSEWNSEISESLRSANLILLLISPDFISSDYCYNQELKIAIEMHEQKKAVVIPVGLRPVDIQNTSFSKLQKLPTAPLFIESWSNRDEAFMNVVQGVRRTLSSVIEQLKKINNWDPIARKDDIRRLVEIANYEEACNRLQDFVEDFTEDEDLKDMASKIKSDFTDVKIDKASPDYLKFYQQFRMAIKEIKEDIFKVLKQVISVQKLAA